MHRRRNKQFPSATVAQLRGISRWAFAGGAVWEKASFSGICVDLPVVLYGKRSLFPGIFGIRHIRYRRGASGVRNMRAVQKTSFWCTRRSSFRGSRCSKQASTVRKRYSVHENPLLWYARVVVCEYVIGYFRRTDNSLKLSATLSGDGIV